MAVPCAFYTDSTHHVPDLADGFFVRQDAEAVNSLAIDDERNAARRKRTRCVGTLWIGIGITSFGTALTDPVQEADA